MAGGKRAMKGRVRMATSMPTLSLPICRNMSRAIPRPWHQRLHHNLIRSINLLHFLQLNGSKCDLTWVLSLESQDVECVVRPFIGLNRSVSLTNLSIQSRQLYLIIWRVNEGETHS